MNIYFLGGGNMASAMIAGLISSSKTHTITVIEHHAEKRQNLLQTYHINALEKLPELENQDTLILAIKPQDLKNSCAKLSINDALVISIASGVDIETLSHYLHGHSRIIRTMPNTPAQIGLGVSALYAPNNITQQDKDTAEQIMAAVGLTLWLATEDQIHDITCISGSGPAYVFYLMNALFLAAKEQGFSEEQSRMLTLATFKGSVILAEKNQAAFELLQHNVTSKGGTTYEALKVFEQHHIAAAIAQGVAACRLRSTHMQKTFSEDK